MGEVKLFGTVPSPFSCRVEWALKLKGIEFEYIEEDLTNKSDLLLMYNPIHKQVPVLLHDGAAIAESVVILEYIEETWRSSGRPLLPDNPGERAVARFWAKFGEEKCRPAIYNVLRYDGNDQQKAIVRLIESFKVLEDHGLKGKKFFNGETIGYADIVIGWIVWWFEAIEDVVNIKLVDHVTFPRLLQWMKDFSGDAMIRGSLPSCQVMYTYFSRKREELLATRAAK